VENAEVEVALEELENRLERLRALYEQYFMGIERIEPAIPRKDVDRRIYVLRREKIRNTAKRFKLQTIISRYNTFQQYWQRICREIENGTYKRHLIRAERIAPGQMLTIAARKRLGRAALEAAMPDSAPPPARDSAPASVQPEAPAAPSVPASAAPPIPSPVPRPGVGAAPPKAVPPPKPGARPAKPAPALAAPPAPPKFESLDLDLDFLGDWDPSAAASKAKRAPEAPARPFGRALNQPLGAAPPPVPLHAAARPAQAPSTAKTVVAPAPPPAPPRVAAERPVIAPRPPAAPAATSAPPVTAALLRPAAAVASTSVAAKPAATKPAASATSAAPAAKPPVAAPAIAKAIAAPIATPLLRQPP
jgi:hypothetical protein